MQSLGPALDDAVQREADSVAAVELLAVDQRALVVHGDGVSGGRGGAVAFLDDLVLQSTVGNDHALLGLVCREKCFTSSLVVFGGVIITGRAWQAGCIGGFLFLFFLHHLSARLVDGIESIAGNLEGPPLQFLQLGQVLGEFLVVLGLGLSLIIVVGLFPVGNQFSQVVGMLLVEPLLVFRLFVFARFAGLAFVRLRNTCLGLVVLGNAGASGVDCHVVIFTALRHLDGEGVALEGLDVGGDGLVHADVLGVGFLAGDVIKIGKTEDAPGTIALG